MDDDAIMQEFAELFGLEDNSVVEESENNEPETETEEQGTVPEEENENEEGASAEEEKQDKPEEQHEDKLPTGSKSKANYAFAELRKQNKEYSNLFKNLGKAIGLADDTPTDQIVSKVQEVLLAKQAKEQNVPVDILREIQELRSIVNENKQFKLENEVSLAFNSLASKYNLTGDQLVEFANHLDAANKNPLNGVDVDLEAEYLKLHHKEMLEAAVADALKNEQNRKEKAAQYGSSGVPSKAGDTGNEESKINTVADLDRYFAGLNL